VTDDEERELRIALMQADLLLKSKQGFWETPRNIALIVAAAAGIAGVLGFKLGQREPLPQPPQIIFQPGSIQVLPAPPTK
jgi:hypothetical protein